MASTPSSPVASTKSTFPAPTTAPTTDNSPPASPVMEGRESPDLPLTMSASTVLATLPHDATAALAAAGKFPTEKVILRFKPIGSAPQLPPKREQVRVTSTQKFESVVTYLRKILGVKEHESLFLYVNSVFAPSLDEVVGNLWRCFKDSRDTLNISYSMTPAFG